MNYADFWAKHHPELHHRNMRKEKNSTSHIILKMYCSHNMQLAQHEVVLRWTLGEVTILT